jgi:lambda family phage minor tail protein L
MTFQYPQEQREEHHKLEADAEVHLYEIQTLDGAVLYFKSNDTVTWQGNTYNGTALHMDGISHNADDERSRPQLKLANPDGVFSNLVNGNQLEGGFVYRHRVLRRHVDNDQNIKKTESWRISRPKALNNKRIVLELRARMDGQTFQAPGRMYMPPDFPQVSLG